MTTNKRRTIKTGGSRKRRAQSIIEYLVMMTAVAAGVILASNFATFNPDNMPLVVGSPSGGPSFLLALEDAIEDVRK